jgi:aspartate 1-decarboxylase
MQLRLLKSKLHMGACTGTNLHYHGSITIDEDLMEAAGLLPYEAVLIANVSTGARGETYVLKGERGKKQMELNGAMARLATTGDRLIVLAFALLDPKEVPHHKPKVAVLDSHNGILEQWEG